MSFIGRSSTISIAVSEKPGTFLGRSNLLVVEATYPRGAPAQEISPPTPISAEVPFVIPAEVVAPAVPQITPPTPIEVPPVPVVPKELIVVGGIALVLLIGGIAYLLYTGGASISG
jgi:hypothetical protein